MDCDSINRAFIAKVAAVIFTKLLVLKNERLRASMLELRSIISFQNTGRIFRPGFIVAFLLTATGCSQIPNMQIQ